MIQTAKEYFNDRKYSNVHTVIHYKIMMHEYEILNNCNVLIEENKHKYLLYLSYLTVD